jgi:hypothetical protein
LSMLRIAWVVGMAWLSKCVIVESLDTS